MNAIESLYFIRSEIFLTVSLIVILVLDFFISRKKWLGWLSCFVVVGAILLQSPFYPPEGEAPFFNFFFLDPFTQFFKMVALLTVGLVILASLAYEKISERQQGEFYVLMLASALLLTVMGAANNLLMIFLAIESVSVISYLLVGFQKFDKRATEASLKYVLFGAVSSALMLFGMSWIFGAAGSLWLSEIGARLTPAEPEVLTIGLIGMLFVLAGIGFKISMVPFHMWAPDVYQGAPTPVTAFLTVAPKALGFAVMLRVVTFAFPHLIQHWTHILAVLAVFTMTIGNLLAISQYDVKRLLGYSSIAQAGYILAGAATATSIGYQAVLIYVAVYLFTNLGAFFTVLAVERNVNSNELQAYNGLSARNPLLALALTVFLLSLAGIPPLAGFIGKLYIFSAVVQSGIMWLAVAIAINSAVAAYYYFKIVKAMYLNPAESAAPFTNPFPIKLAVSATFIGTFLLGLLPNRLIELAGQSLVGFPLF